MTNNNLLIILGNQLFPIKYIKETNCTDIFMCEDYELCTEYKHHKLKILMFFISMREYKKELIKNGYNVHYYSIEDKDFKDNIESKLSKLVNSESIKTIHNFELVDNFLKDRFKKMDGLKNILWKSHNSPMFILSKTDFNKYAFKKNKFLQAHFYKYMRKKLNILIDDKEQPKGGKWSFDEENRKKIAKNIAVPSKPLSKKHENFSNIKESILTYFSNHPGSMNNLSLIHI